eukprot:3883676-Prymnesium_polylepis.1
MGHRAILRPVVQLYVKRAGSCLLVVVASSIQPSFFARSLVARRPALPSSCPRCASTRSMTGVASARRAAVAT